MTFRTISRTVVREVQYLHPPHSWSQAYPLRAYEPGSMPNAQGPHQGVAIRFPACHTLPKSPTNSFRMLRMPVRCSACECGALCQLPTPPRTSLLACDSVGHGSWLGAAGQLLTHRSCAPLIRDSNIREHFDSNSTYHPAVCPVGWTAGNRRCSESLHIMGECWHPFPRSGQFGNVSKSVARAIRPYA